jgi:nucleolar complex protein 2
VTVPESNDLHSSFAFSVQRPIPTILYTYTHTGKMVNKSKQFKKFASSGKLKETIDKRRKNQQSRRKADDRTTRRAKQRGAPLEFGENEDGDGSDDDDKEVRSANAAVGGRAGGVAKNVEELFGNGGLDGVDNGEGSDLEDLSEEDEEETETEGEVEEGEEDMLDEEAMKKAMKDLEKKDPEFFKYLKENDEDLLEFGKGKSKVVEEEGSDVEMESDAEDQDEDEEEEEEEEKKTSVTVKMVRQWQEGMIKVSPSQVLPSLPSFLPSFFCFVAIPHHIREMGLRLIISNTRFDHSERHYSLLGRQHI